MGDRCSLTLTIHGHIETVEVLEELLEQLEEYGLEDSMEHEAIKGFANAIAFETSPQFSAGEVNYANIEGVEQTLQMYEIAYAAENGAGGDYGPSCWSWSKTHGRLGSNMTTDGEVVLELKEIDAALNMNDPLIAVSQIVANAKMARGEGLPQFSVSEEVKRHLAVTLGVKALSPAHV